MRFQKGQSGNPAGRKKGSKNIAGRTVKAAINDALQNRSDQIADKLDAIKDPVKWLECFAKLASFIIAKEESIEIVDRVNELTDEQLMERVKQLTNGKK